MKNKYNCVLLIDDDHITNYINQRLLKKLNVTEHINCVNSGMDGLKYIENFCESNNQHSPELIFLDVNMPGLKGYDFLKEYEKLSIKNKEQVKIVVISASSNDIDRERIKAYNLPYLTKPLTIEAIRDIV